MAVLSGGGKRFAGLIKFVPVVPQADLKLDLFRDISQHGGRVKDHTQTIPELGQEVLRKARMVMGYARKCKLAQIIPHNLLLPTWVYKFD